MQLVVDGVDDPLKAAVIAGVSLSQYAKRDASEAQVRRLYERPMRRSARPCSPTATTKRTRTGKLEQVGKDWRVTLHVTPGRSG